MVAAAIGGSAVLGLAGSAIQSSAASSAAKSQQNAANTATSDTLQMYNQSRADLAPYREAGDAASNQLSYLLGIQGPSTSSTGFAGAGSSSDPASALPSNVSNILSNIHSSSPNLAYPDGSQAFIDKLTSQAAAMTPDQYTAWANANGLSGTDQSVFSNAVNPPAVDPNAAGANNGYGSSVNSSLGAFGSLSQPFTTADMQTDPGYQFRLQQGNTALQNAQNAAGGLYSGAALKEADAYNSGQAAQQYNTAYDQYNTNQNNLYNRLAGVTNSGLGATNTGVTSNTSAGNSLATIAGQAGNAAANSAVNSSNIYNQGISSLLGGGKSSYSSGGNLLNNLFGSSNSSSDDDWVNSLGTQ